MHSFSERSVQILAENLMRQARDDGKFDNLPGTGKPLADIDEPYDPDWWLKKKMKEDDLSEAFKEYQRTLMQSSGRSPERP
jgi:hypothetical protein